MWWCWQWRQIPEDKEAGRDGTAVGLPAGWSNEPLPDGSAFSVSWGNEREILH